MRCPNCNKILLFKTKHCNKCGKEIQLNKTKKKPLSTNKIIYIVIVVLLFLFLSIVVLKEKYNEKSIAIKYFESLINESTDGFKYLDAKEDKFVNNKTYKKVLINNKNLKDVINYTIQDINYSQDKKASIITISYITKKNKKHQTTDIELVNKGKKYLLFNNWKVDTRNIISKNYRIYISKQYKVKLDGIILDNKDLDSTEGNYNIYRIKNIFIGDYKVTVKHKDLDLETNVLVQKKNSSSYVNNLTLPQEISNEITKSSVGQLEILYKNSIKSNSFDEIKSKLTYTKDSKIKDIYNRLQDTTNYYYAQLKSFDVKDYHLIVSKVEDDKINLTVAIKYKYKRNYYRQVQEKEKTDDITFVLKKEDNKYKIYDIKNLTYYYY